MIKTQKDELDIFSRRWHENVPILKIKMFFESNYFKEVNDEKNLVFVINDFSNGKGRKI